MESIQNFQENYCIAGCFHRHIQLMYLSSWLLPIPSQVPKSFS